jgi:signal transduction histidine kinase
MGADTLIASAVLEYVTASAPLLMLELDQRQRVIKANAHASRVLGGNLTGKTLRELVIDFTPVPEPLASDAKAGKSHILSMDTANGLPESFSFEFFALPTGWLALGSLDFDEQFRLRNEVLGLNNELNDLTRQLHQANAELRELNEVKNQFLGMAAHDLRKPVSVITTYTEFVLDEAGNALEDEHRKFLQTCLNAATALKELIDNFLNVAVIESGRLRLDFETVTAEAILEGALEICRLIAARKDIALIVEALSEGQPMRVDVPRLQLVLVNLISNAVEHSQPGQRVRVSSRSKERDWIFAVKDEGPGISEEDKARLFQPFERAGTRKTAGERSTGLGLAIARQVVEAHRGRLWVESDPGAGATFFVSLPIKDTLEQKRE